MVNSATIAANAQIVDDVTDLDFVAEHATGRPFCTEISYLLVSMECLIGVPYTRAVQARGLAGSTDPMMGRVEARVADWRIAEPVNLFEAPVSGIY